MTDDNKRRPLFRASIVAAAGALAYLAMPGAAAASGPVTKGKPIMRSARAAIGLPSRVAPREIEGVPPLEMLIQPNADLGQAKEKLMTRIWAMVKDLSALEGLSDANRVELKMAALQFADQAQGSFEALHVDRSRLRAEHQALSAQAERYLTRLQDIRAAANLDDIEDSCQ